MRLASIHVYPIKGCRGIALASAEVESRGFAHDRRFMIVDQAGRFITQREEARLALVETAIEGDRLRVSAVGTDGFEVPLSIAEGPRRTVTVWSSTLEAIVVDGVPSAFFSDFLGLPCALVHMPSDARRAVPEKYARPGEMVSFADAFPFLLTTEASLADLDARLPNPVPMNRFRPNLVIAGSAPWAEDAWTDLRIGDVAFRNAKPCDRCVVTTIDQETAARGPEPLRTLSGFRGVFEERTSLDGRTSQQKKVLFGINLCPLETGVLRVGDRVVA